jgi:nickel/cobalt exporter
MNSTVLTTVAATGFTVAFFHAALPTHWLPFVLVARAREWSRTKTLSVAVLAGLGHIGLTSLLGLAIAWFGFQLDEQLGGTFPWIAGGILVLMGFYYIWRQISGRGICHHAVPGGHHHASEECGHESEQSHLEHEVKDSDLVLSGVKFGWYGFLVLSLILAVATLAGMTLFTWLALVGMGRFKMGRFERWEAGLLGALFCALGLLVIVLEH